MKKFYFLIFSIFLFSCEKSESAIPKYESFDFTLDFQDNLIILNGNYYLNWDMQDVCPGNDTISIHYPSNDRIGSNTDFEFFSNTYNIRKVEILNYYFPVYTS